ncbi:MAG TPA: Asp23/Gls24 family envelope stress response protein [Gaiellaceae bacterium]|nr:Asp23/Gls24 family envelope stress response protein [Gaiellaceae bacterium]
MSAHVIKDEAGTIEISPGALTQVVVQAAESADGARVRRPRRGLEIEVENGRARVELELAARFGVVLPELARDVQARVADALQTMCGLSVDAIDVSVEELDG